MSNARNSGQYNGSEPYSLCTPKSLHGATVRGAVCTLNLALGMVWPNSTVTVILHFNSSDRGPKSILIKVRLLSKHHFLLAL